MDAKEKEDSALLENNDYFVKNTLRKYFVPTVISLLGSTAITFINTMITGNLYGKEALAAVNLINPVTFLFAMFGCLICIGGATCTSVAMGQEDVDYGRVTPATASLVERLLPERTVTQQFYRAAWDMEL